MKKKKILSFVCIAIIFLSVLFSSACFASTENNVVQTQNTVSSNTVKENIETVTTNDVKNEKVIAVNTSVKNNVRRTASNKTLYVAHIASFISTTVHNRSDGYGILIRKFATDSSYSDVKQAFCIEMGIDINSRSLCWCYRGQFH